YDISFVIGIAALLAGGAVEAILAMSCATLVLREPFHRSPIRNLFNLSQLIISTGTGSLVYLSTGGRTGRGITASTSLGQHVLVPLLAATAVMFLANSSLVSLAISISERRRLIETWQRVFGSLAGN